SFFPSNVVEQSSPARSRRTRGLSLISLKRSRFQRTVTSSAAPPARKFQTAGDRLARARVSTSSRLSSSARSIGALIGSSRLQPAAFVRRGQNCAASGDGGAAVGARADLGRAAFDQVDERRHLVAIRLHADIRERRVRALVLDRWLLRNRPPAGLIRQA